MTLQTVSPVTVIVHTFLSRAVIADCLDAVAGQDYGNAARIEVIDRGSTDGTLDIVRSRLPAAAVQVDRRRRAPLDVVVSSVPGGGLTVECDASVRLPRGFLRWAAAEVAAGARTVVPVVWLGRTSFGRAAAAVMAGAEAGGATPRGRDARPWRLAPETPSQLWALCTRSDRPLGSSAARVPPAMVAASLAAAAAGSRRTARRLLAATAAMVAIQALLYGRNRSVAPHRAAAALAVLVAGELVAPVTRFVATRGRL